MSNKDWDEIVKEPMSEGLKARTMARARQELEALEATKSFSWAWLIPLVPGLAALLFFIRQKEDSDAGPMMADADGLMEDLEQLSIEELAALDEETLENLEFYQDLDVLEDWDGQEES